MAIRQRHTGQTRLPDVLVRCGECLLPLTRIPDQADILGCKVLCMNKFCSQRGVTYRVTKWNVEVMLDKETQLA